MKVALDRDGNTAATAAFELAFNRWFRSAQDNAEGVDLYRVVEPYLGNCSPSRFFKLDTRTQLKKMDRLLLHIPSLPELAGDPARVTALVAATAASDAAITALEASERVWSDLGRGDRPGQAVRCGVRVAGAPDRAARTPRPLRSSRSSFGPRR